MNAEIGTTTQGAEDSSNRFAYEGAGMGIAGGLLIAAVEESPVFETPDAHDIGLSVGFALCVAGVARVLQHAREHWRTTPASRLVGWQK